MGLRSGDCAEKSVTFSAPWSSLVFSSCIKALRCVRAHNHVTSRETLWNTVMSCWDNMSQQVLHELVESKQL